jgi:hypothetical protein
MKYGTKVRLQDWSKGFTLYMIVMMLIVFCLPLISWLQILGYGLACMPIYFSIRVVCNLGLKEAVRIFSHGRWGEY